LPISVHASPGLPEMEAREDGHKRHGKKKIQTEIDEEQQLS